MQEVIGYLDILAEKAEEEAKPVVAVLDNAPFHRAGALQEERAKWEAKGLRVYYLPAYCPHLNLIEGVWKRLSRDLLMPRRFYDTLADCKGGCFERIEVVGSCGDSLSAWRYLVSADTGNRTTRVSYQDINAPPFSEGKLQKSSTVIQ